MLITILVQNILIAYYYLTKHNFSYTKTNAHKIHKTILYILLEIRIGKTYARFWLNLYLPQL